VADLRYEPDAVTEADHRWAVVPPETTIRHTPRVVWTDSRGAHAMPLSRRLVAGSSQSADLIVADPTVSRLHAELEQRQDGVWIRDLGSRNGTFVEGVKVKDACVPAGASVKIGVTVLQLSAADQTTEVPLWPRDRFQDLIGRSLVMRELFARLDRVARTDATVLIHGETGTGKEIVAEAIHKASSRAEKNFVVVDCGALPPNLLEAELFGHTKGAFTGAAQARAGVFEMAEGGTIFLDEIGDLPLDLQPKLLRAIESRSVRRVGETMYRKIDARVLAATHRDLASMVNAGGFREDLYFRLAVVHITVPPLRTRMDDAPLLVEHFAQGRPLGLELMREIRSLPWLGNVRELRNFVESALVMGRPDRRALPREAPAAPAVEAAPTGLPAVTAGVPFKVLRDHWLGHLEREYVRALVAAYRDDTAAMAAASGLDRSYIYRLLKKHPL
jgi:two-component system, NtrC family, response regulator GlrR